MAIQAVGLNTHIWNNNIKSALFLLLYPILITSVYIAAMATIVLFLKTKFAGMTESYSFFDVLGYVIFDYWYAPYAIVTTVLAAVYFYHRNRINLGPGLTVVTRQNNAELHNLLENLCISRGLKMPLLFIQRYRHPNAYTWGLTDDTSYIVLTSALVAKLTPEEIECVLAHELTHLINRDTRLMILTTTVCNILKTLAEMVKSSTRGPYTNDETGKEQAPFNILAFIFSLGHMGALIVHCLVSRKREYIADTGAVQLTKNPKAMIAALIKVRGGSLGYSPFKPGVRPLLLDYHDAFERIATHPPITARIFVLEEINRIRFDDPMMDLKPWRKSFVKQAISHGNESP